MLMLFFSYIKTDVGKNVISPYDLCRPFLYESSVAVVVVVV